MGFYQTKVYTLARTPTVQKNQANSDVLKVSSGWELSCCDQKRTVMTIEKAVACINSTIIPQKLFVSLIAASSFWLQSIPVRWSLAAII